ncbi:MAG: response regulator [Clostridiales Family XIII bacterium]|jgi:signal transduction histidine kinase/CheY-like chemotaxis protein|nr:response regulator [Clostridiales Family XIII bacterium]
MSKYIYNDNLSFDARVLNLVCIVGTFALLASAIGHIVEQSNWLMMLLKIVMILGAIILLYISNRFNVHKYGRIAVIILFCDVLFPLVFLVNGGSNGGMAAYFVLTMILIVLLSKVPTLFIFMGIHIVIVVSCYMIDRYYQQYIIPLNTFQHYADNIISITVAGIFIGLVVKGINSLLLREQAKAEAASRAKGEFLSQMSHEMRTPLNAIIGMASIISNSNDIEDHMTDVKKIETASTHLLGVINDILDMSKIEANKLELVDMNFGFRKMIDGITTVMIYSVEDKKQELMVDIDPAIPENLKGDRQRLAQVITNLLSNAIKFTPDGGQIGLTSQLIGENDGKYSIRTNVLDTGIGITDEQKSRLFRSFEQADNSTSRRFGGTGLGLAISKKIVDLMGGDIWAESELGQGSSFTFEVSLEGGDEAGETQDNAEAAAFDFTGKTILIAEDIDINREIITTLLEATNITMDTAENGEEALKKVEAGGGKYDLIFMDIQMPEMDGYEATAAIRASETAGAKDVPIIAMTANVFKDDIDRALAAGMNGHLGKPIVIDDVLAMLAKYLT